MSLESAIADLVSASTQLTQSVNVTRATVEATRDTVIAQEAPVTAAKDATVASATVATADTATTASKLTTAAADYSAQKTTKGLAAVQTSAETELKDRLHRRDPARYPFRGARPSLVMDFVRRECHRNNAAGNLEQVDLNSFMTFTRASTATYVGPDGLIKEAASNVPRYGHDPVTGEALGLLIEEQRTNLLTYSSDFLGWVAEGVTVNANVSTSPNGTLTATKLIAASTTGYHLIRKPYYTVATGKTFTVYAKKCEYTGVLLSASNTPFPANEVVVSLVNGSVISTGTMVSGVVVTPFADGWFRISVQYNSLEDTTWNIGVCDGSSRSFTGNNTSGIYIWGAQLEAGAFPTSYIPTPATFTGRASTKTYFDSNGVLQTAASGVAVTDYGYVDGRWVSKGLSLEPQATNVALYSSGSNTSGYDSDSTTSVNATTVSGVGLNNFVSTSGFRRRISWFGTPLGKDNVVVSLFVAKQTGSVTLGFAPWEGSTGNATTVALDMGTGVGVLTKGSHTTASLRVEDCGSLWRVSVALTYLGGHYTLGTFYFTSTLTSLTLGGLQAETGPVATSYIPTTTAQVTRAADTSTSAQVTRASDAASSGAALFIMDAGTTLVSGRMSANGAYPGMYNWVGDYFVFRNVANGQLALNGRGSGGLIGVNATDAGNPIRHATRRSRNYIASSANNGTVVGTPQPLSNSSTVTTLLIGEGSSKWNGYIQQLTYFPRQLSDADLQALTILED